MFRMHQSTRRRLFRTGFLLVCVAPLVALAGWGWHVRRAGYAHSHEIVLRQTLGLRVSIGQVIHPRPGVVRYQDLELAEAETGRAIAQFRTAEMRAPAAGNPVELAIHGVTMAPEGTTSLFGLVDQLLRSDFRSGDTYLTISTDAIKFDAASGFPAIKGMTATIWSTAEKAEARIELISAEPALFNSGPAISSDTASEQSNSWLRVVRNRKADKTIEGFELNTGALALPCDALAPLAGGNLAGMSGSQFQGEAFATQEENGWRVVVRNARLLDVDLDQLVGSRFGHQVAGRADVQIPWAESKQGRLREAHLVVSGGPGRVSRSLLAAASQSLRLSFKYDSAPGGDMFPYKQLSAEVWINDQGAVWIAGKCDGSPGALLLAADGEWLWTQASPQPQPQPVSALLRALVAGDTPTAPAKPEIAWLLARLPIEATARRATPPK